MRHLLEAEGLADRVEVDSAGTSAYHAGERPDRRATAAAARRGIALVGVARQFEREDWRHFDYVLAVDRSTQRLLEQSCPADAAHKLRLLRELDPEAPPGTEVPDPYYGGEDGFEHVLDMCEAACRGMLGEIRARLAAGRAG